MAGAIWAVTEVGAGGLKGISNEVVACGQKLAQALGKPLEAVVIGSGARAAAEKVAAKDVTGLARHFGCPPARIEAVCDTIRRLDPRPGWRFGTRHIQYVTPDVVVKKVRGQWTASLNPIIVPKVRVNHVYAAA